MDSNNTIGLLELQAVPVYTRFSNPDNGFEVICYREYPYSTQNKEFCAAGKNLPQNKKAVVQLTGYWEATKYGNTFKVVSHETKEFSTKESLCIYLTSLKIGFGKAKSDAIWKEFGSKAWEIIQNNPEKIKGIKYGKLHRSFKDEDVAALKKAVTEAKMDLAVINLLNSYGVSVLTSKKVVAFLKEHNMAVEDIKTEIYSLSPLPFSVMEKVGADYNISPTHPKRLEHAAGSVFFQNSVSGHICMKLNDFMRKMDAELKKYRRNAGVSRDEMVKFVIEGCKNDKLVYQKAYDMIYPAYRWEQEKGIAQEIQRILKKGHKLTEKDSDIEVLLQRFEKENNITLSKSQRNAVKILCKSPVGILTGGPGTGKSTITKAVLFMYEQLSKYYNPVLLAPTGRAARRMTECNDGITASTIHSAIMYCGENEEQEAMTLSKEPLEGSVFIVDEVSMMDESIAYELLQRIPDGASIIFVGDPDQLPSVGAGNVLAQMLASKVIPTAKLTEIFRQKGGNGSCIIENAAAIKDGKTNLVFDNQTFSFCPTTTPEQTEQAACNFYIKCVEKYGIDNVLLLNAYRSKSNVCADRFNLKLRDALNPYSESKEAVKLNGKNWRVGDRVMQMRNTNNIKNGDIGKITSIKDGIVSILFEEKSEPMPYDADMMKDVDLAYCSTVHKAQGQEAKIIILVMTHENSMGLKRNLLYTAVTRAKGNVLIVGQYDALLKAINNANEENRNTLLANCLKTYVA